MLSEEQQNFIKDILKLIGRDDELNASIAATLGMELSDFNEMADGIYTKLGNGRLIVENPS